MDTSDSVLCGIMLTMLAVIIGLLGWAIGTQDAVEDLREIRVERCVANQGTPLVDRGSRVLCFNPQVVQEVW